MNREELRQRFEKGEIEEQERKARLKREAEDIQHRVCQEMKKEIIKKYEKEERHPAVQHIKLMSLSSMSCWACKEEDEQFRRYFTDKGFRFLPSKLKHYGGISIDAKEGTISMLEER